MSHTAQSALRVERLRLAETPAGEIRRLAVDLSLVAIDVAVKTRSEAIFRRSTRATEAQQAAARRAVEQARRTAFVEVLALERFLAQVLTPWLDQRAPYDVARAQAWARNVAVIAVGFEKATKARKQAVAPLVCVGNTQVRWPESWQHGSLGCFRVYRGQWRRAREGEELIALGPRCKWCRRRIGEDRRQLVDRATRGLS